MDGTRCPPSLRAGRAARGPGASGAERAAGGRAAARRHAGGAAPAGCAPAVVPKLERQALGRRRLLVLHPQERAQHRIVQLVLRQLQAELLHERGREMADAGEGEVLRGGPAGRGRSGGAPNSCRWAHRAAPHTSSCSAGTPSSAGPKPGAMSLMRRGVLERGARAARPSPRVSRGGPFAVAGGRAAGGMSRRALSALGRAAPGSLRFPSRRRMRLPLARSRDWPRAWSLAQSASAAAAPPPNRRYPPPPPCPAALARHPADLRAPVEPARGAASTKPQPCISCRPAGRSACARGPSGRPGLPPAWPFALQRSPPSPCPVAWRS
jgi:hypothetical protein